MVLFGVAYTGRDELLVGGMIGRERTVLPLGRADVPPHASTATLTFVLSFGASPASS